MAYVQLMRDTKTGMFYPSTEYDDEQLKHVRRGHAIHGEFRRARNPAHHRKAWALITAVFENQERYANVNQLLTELKIATGFVDEHVTMDGEIVYVPRSISFASMDQNEFDKFYAAALGVIAEKFGMEDLAAEYA